jgi:hypothetical protein
MTNEGDRFLGVSEGTSSRRPQLSTGLERFPFLKTLSNIYRALAFISGMAAVICLFLGIVLMNHEQITLGLTVILISVVCGPIAVITNLATAEAILVFLAIEENTRQ